MLITFTIGYNYDCCHLTLRRINLIDAWYYQVDRILSRLTFPSFIYENFRVNSIHTTLRLPAQMAVPQVFQAQEIIRELGKRP